MRYEITLDLKSIGIEDENINKLLRDYFSRMMDVVRRVAKERDDPKLLLKFKQNASTRHRFNDIQFDAWVALGMEDGSVEAWEQVLLEELTKAHDEWCAEHSISEWLNILRMDPETLAGILMFQLI
ncbi:MAG: hypothetical protein A3B96_00185 [Candidatus Spechtbacteria bacterium RIFCSPHIGHO2_02_FULL_43_15b]|nr:MAG: hypothetical protein A3B96_00185 [Candidatus Spechtbacteria bacterium RIFCSPHIGHO2_02_FULL_43_15b]